MIIPGQGERLVKARTLAGARQTGRNISQTTMAELLTAELRRLGSDITVSQSQLSDWENEIREPPLVVYRAAANLSELDERYLAFGMRDATPQETHLPTRRKAGGER